VSAVLRLYGPEECEAWLAGMARGPRPLDWERCRTCKGKGHGYEGAYSPLDPCPTCGGHGSLRAAALAHFRGDEAAYGGRMRLGCSGCGHPMSDGTWEGPAAELLASPLDSLTPERLEAEWVERERDHRRIIYNATPWSPCDEGCRHAGPLRVWAPWAAGPVWKEAAPSILAGSAAAGARESGDEHTPEASWRQVDVRTLGWAFDLRPESLAVLCTRCWADRG
jgi:hypothetical protein